MATPTGKVSFDADGVAHTLQFTTNRLCLLEDKLGLTTLEIATELALAKSEPLSASARTIRGLFWAGVGSGQTTMEQAGDLIDRVGRPRAVALAIEAFDAAFPDTEEGEPKSAGEGENPQSGAAG